MAFEQPILMPYGIRWPATLQVAFHSHDMPSGGYLTIYFLEAKDQALGTTIFHFVGCLSVAGHFVYTANETITGSQCG